MIGEPGEPIPGENDQTTEIDEKKTDSGFREVLGIEGFSESDLTRLTRAVYEYGCNKPGFVKSLRTRGLPEDETKPFSSEFLDEPLFQIPQILTEISRTYAIDEIICRHPDANLGDDKDVISTVDSGADGVNKLLLRISNEGKGWSIIYQSLWSDPKVREAVEGVWERSGGKMKYWDYKVILNDPNVGVEFFHRIQSVCAAVFEFCRQNYPDLTNIFSTEVIQAARKAVKENPTRKFYTGETE
jgi:hypothetical protein